MPGLESGTQLPAKQKQSVSAGSAGPRGGSWGLQRRSRKTRSLLLGHRDRHRRESNGFLRELDKPKRERLCVGGQVEVMRLQREQSFLR